MPAKTNPRAGQLAFEFGIHPQGVPVGAVAVVTGTRSKLLTDAIRACWDQLGFTAINDEAFFQVVAARLVEPTSKRDIRVINQLGMQGFHENTYYAALGRCVAGDYREQIAKACFNHVWTDAGGDISLLLYDVTVRHSALVVRGCRKELNSSQEDSGVERSLGGAHAAFIRLHTVRSSFCRAHS